MAIQSEIYSGTAIQGNRHFPSTKFIQSKRHMQVYLQDSLDKWTELSDDNYELINNTCVLNEELDTPQTKALELRVADNEGDLAGTPASINELLKIKDDIEILVKYVDDIKAIAKVAPNLENHLTKIDHHLDVVEKSIAQAHADAKTALESANLVTQTAKTIEDDLKNGQHLVTELNTIKHETEVFKDLALVAKANAKISENSVNTSKAKVLDSESNSKLSESNSEKFSIEAQHWATMPHGQDIPESAGSKSSMHWAIESAKYAVPASTADIEAGTDNVKEITSLGYKHAFGYYLGKSFANHSGGIPILDANGKLSPTVMPHSRDMFMGSFIPATGAEYPTGTKNNGDFYIISGLNGTDYRFTTGDLVNEIVSDRDELVTDGSHWFIVGKADFDGSIYIKKDHFANNAQVIAGTSDDTVISPKVLSQIKENMVMDVVNLHASIQPEAGKLIKFNAQGRLEDGTLGHGIGETATLKEADAPMTVGTIRAWNLYGVYCLPTIDVSGKLMSDTKKFFGIDNLYTEVAIVPQRDKNIFCMYGLKGNVTVMFVMVIPKSADDALVLTDSNAPKFKILEIVHPTHINDKLALKLDKTATATDSAKFAGALPNTFVRGNVNDINKIISLTKHDYDALSTKDAHTVYIIKK